MVPTLFQVFSLPLLHPFCSLGARSFNSWFLYQMLFYVKFSNRLTLNLLVFFTNKGIG
jgi:hypothetical protein